MANGTPAQGETARQIAERAREATNQLRDATREGRVINFRQRDPLVTDIHKAIDLAESVAALTADLAQARQENAAWKAKQYGYESEADRLTTLVAETRQQHNIEVDKCCALREQLYEAQQALGDIALVTAHAEGRRQGLQDALIIAVSCPSYPVGGEKSHIAGKLRQLLQAPQATTAVVK